MKLNTHLVVMTSMATTLISGCGSSGSGAEPALPTTDPAANVVTSNEGLRIKGDIAIDPANKAYHVSHLVTGSHKIDTKSPPLSLTAVKASCRIVKPAATDRKFVVIAGVNYGGRRSNDKKTLSGQVQPTFTAFSKNRVEKIAKKRAARLEKGGTTKGFTGRDFAAPKAMGRIDVIVTESQKPAFVVLSGAERILYNFTISPYAKVSGVLVYTNDEGAAIAGLDPSVPVYFQSALAPMTKRCWVRAQQKPDKTWAGHRAATRGDNSNPKVMRYNALKPIHSKFASKVRRDIGAYSSSDFLSVDKALYVLLGPAPTRLEQRIPYSPVAGSHIKFMQADYSHYGTRREVDAYIEQVVDKRAHEIFAEK